MRHRRQARPVTRLRLRLGVAALALVAVVGGACSSSSSRDESRSTGSVPSPTRGGALVVATTSEVDGFNPLTSQWSAPGFQIGRTVLDPLAVMDVDGDPQPYLAEAFESSDDFRTWTIRLRDGVSFHNGEVFDAQALVTYLDAVMASPLASSGFPEIPRITATGPLEVELTFTKPWSRMPVIFADQPGYVIAPEQVGSGDTAHPIGTGPFVFDEWIPDQHFRAVRNDGYWRDGLPYLDEIEFRPLSDQTARYQTLLSDAADVVEAAGITLDSRAEFDDAGMTIVDEVDAVGASTLLMNLDAEPTDDLRVRQAIVAAIDRQALQTTLADESFELATQPHAPDSRWYAANDYPETDVEAARALVEDYEDERGPVEIRIMVIAVGRQLETVEVLQQALEDVGIDVSIDSLETVGFIQQFISGDYETVYLGGFLLSADPDGIYHFLHSDNAADDKLVKLNFPRHRNPDLDAALEQQRTTDDDAERAEIWAGIWRILAEDLPYAWLLHGNTAFVTQPDVHGFDGFETPEGVPIPAINIWTPFYTAVYRGD
jgi:ABC-type transport system substrate-binding protein